MAEFSYGFLKLSTAEVIPECRRTGGFMTDYIQALSKKQLGEAAALFREYAASLGCSPCLQNIEKELDHLPGEYAPPGGRLILAQHDGTVCGCVAIRRLEQGIAEMRRMYVQPAARGIKIGHGLAEFIIKEARIAGYARMRLYTLPSMKEAIALYRSLGFREIAPYGEQSIPDGIYMELDLNGAGLFKE
jgi:ribosomal protein S18 acetylase RimI-like enzyme